MLKVLFNKKAFVLMEAIVVIVVISVALLTLFASYNKILSKVRSENKYDLSEYLYKTYYVKEYLLSDRTSINVYDLGGSSGAPTNYAEEDNFNSAYKIKKIYILSNINGEKTEDNLKYFDAYMIDYIKRLDVSDETSLIVVEYYKEARDNKYNIVKLYDSETELNETYIASLEW